MGTKVTKITGPLEYWNYILENPISHIHVFKSFIFMTGYITAESSLSL